MVFWTEHSFCGLFAPIQLIFHKIRNIVNGAMNRRVSTAGLGTVFLALVCHCALAGASAFDDCLVQARGAAERGDFGQALENYASARKMATGNSTNLCLLSRCYCDLTWLANSKSLQKELIAKAMACAAQAVAADPQNATAHSSLAVCYAKDCTLVDIKTELEDSRRFKQEAEKAIALDPKQDIAYYLLGRWNYGIAGAGWLSRTYVKIVYGGLPDASFQTAIADFQKACELAPARILNHTALAMAYAAVGDKKSELAELRKACALKPLGPEDRDALERARRELTHLER